MAFTVEVKPGCVSVYKRDGDKLVEVAKFFTVNAMSFALAFLDSIK